MKRALAAVICLAVPGVLFLNVWEGYRYDTLANQVAALEKQQKDLLDANRDAIAQIAYESSPERVEQKAAGVLDLRPLPQSAVARLHVGGAMQNPRDTAMQNPRDTAMQNPRDTAMQNPRDTAMQGGAAPNPPSAALNPPSAAQ